MPAPTPQSFPQKVLGARAGRPVAPGETLDLAPDLALSHDDTAEIARLWAGGEQGRIADPDLHVVVLDHCAPGPGSRDAREHGLIRAFVEAQGIESFFDVDNGIRHQVLAEQGYLLPGLIALGSDPQATTGGALGALAMDVGAAGLASVMRAGRAALTVPRLATVTVTGRAAPGVGAMDVALRVLGELGRDGGRGLGLAFGGPAVAAAGVPARLTLCAMAAEAGAAAAWVEPDGVTLAWLNGRARDDFAVVRGDPDAPVERALAFDLGALAPLVARPDGVVVTAGAAGAVPVQVVIVGGCANGRLPDLHAAALLLRGHRVAAGTRMFVVPASREVARAAAADGTLLALLDAGAIVMNPGCGICDRPHAGGLDAGEAAVSTAGGRAYRNQGGEESAVWLASPLTAAASAVAGRLADPREFAGESILRAVAADAAAEGATAEG